MEEKCYIRHELNNFPSRNTKSSNHVEYFNIACIKSTLSVDMTYDITIKNKLRVSV